MRNMLFMYQLANCNTIDDYDAIWDRDRSVNLYNSKPLFGQHYILQKIAIGVVFKYMSMWCLLYQIQLSVDSVEH